MLYQRNMDDCLLPNTPRGRMEVVRQKLIKIYM